MEKRYYIVEREMRAEDRIDSICKERAFIIVSENKLEHIAGDRFITKMMEFKGENLRPKDVAKSKYVILPLSELQFDIYKEQYEYVLEKVNN